MQYMARDTGKWTCTDLHMLSADLPSSCDMIASLKNIRAAQLVHTRESLAMPSYIFSIFLDGGNQGHKIASGAGTQGDNAG